MKKNLFLLFYLCFALTFHAQNIFTACGNGAGNSGGDGGPAYAAQLQPNAIALDNSGNLYIVDYWNSRVRKVNTLGTISTIAGTGVNGNSGDGGPAIMAQLNKPSGIVVDALGNIYIAELVGNRIRKINSAGIINTIAGTGAVGYSGDGGAAISATFNSPQFLTVDAMNNIYVSDCVNACVRKIDVSGTITTVAGTGTSGFSGDGGLATSAQLYVPANLAVDASNNLYIADYYNDRIRKVDNSGIITTIAGSLNGFSGDGGLATSAKLNKPIGISVDGSGNIYIADTYNHRIRKINSSGIISTIAGTGTSGYSGDGGLASVAELALPFSVIVDPSGNIYICDSGNSRVREICYTACLAGIKEIKSPDFITVYPNPASNEISINYNNFDKNLELELFDILGKKILHKKLGDESKVDISQLPNATYFCLIKHDGVILSREKLIVSH